MTTFQLYLWSWCESELRFRRFIKQKNIQRVYTLSSDDLNDNENFFLMLDFFSVQYAEYSKVVSVAPINTNEDSGFGQTIVTQKDLDEFRAFFEMLPKSVIAEMPTFREWCEIYSCT